MKKYILIIVFLITFFAFYIIQKNSYSIRINFPLKGMNCEKINFQIANKISEILLQIEQIKDFVIFSKQDSCSVYIKIKPFLMLRKKLAFEIARKFDNEFENLNFDLDDEYDYPYCTFFIMATDDSYYDLKKKAQDILEKLLNLKIASEVEAFSPEIVTYIHFDYNTLLNYDLSVSDIKNIILKTNIKNTSSLKSNTKSSFSVDTNGNINNIDDIKSIALYQKNKKFSILLKDVFEVENALKTPPLGLIFFDEYKAVIFAIKKRKFYPAFLFYYKLKKYRNFLNKNMKNYKFTIINSSKLKKTEVYLQENSSTDALFDLYKKIKHKGFKNTLYLLSMPNPKIGLKDEFFEYLNNRLIILSNPVETNKIRKFLKKNKFDYIKENKNKIEIYKNTPDEIITEIKNFSNNYINNTTSKKLQINYQIVQYFLRDYGFIKNEVIDAIFASNDGLEAGYYFDEKIKIPIIIKAKNQKNNFIYSNTYKTLFPFENLTKTFIKNSYYMIVRKNGKYYAELIRKNPSI